MLDKGDEAMAANGLVQVRIDNNVKKEAAAVPAGIGLTVSDAVRLLLMHIAQDKAMPFNPFIPNAETVCAIRPSRKYIVNKNLLGFITDLH
jgi:DNA-damage-inducible protein J